jgi:5,5'-dehydrodivanillate O-demethylase
LYDHTGRCLEQPAEDMEAPDSTFKERTIITAYPVQELGGLIFAYLGPQPAPLLPHWEPLLRNDRKKAIGWGVVPCNWIQIMENSLDPTHVEWLHRRFDNYVLERNGQSNLHYAVPHHAKIGFDVFEYGIIKRRMWIGGSEQDPEWAIGHPVLFPNMLGFGQIRVPMDDEHTMYWWYESRPYRPDEAPQDEIPLWKMTMPGLNEEGHPTWDLLGENAAQDILMWYTQGPVADRTTEKLGTSDKGIMLFRKLLLENAEKVQRGEDPMAVIRDPARNVSIHINNESDGGGRADQRVRVVAGRVGGGGHGGKANPLNDMTTLEAQLLRMGMTREQWELLKDEDAERIALQKIY